MEAPTESPAHSQGCKQVTDLDERPKNITEANWRKKQAKVHNYIISSLSNAQLDLISADDTPKQIIQKLDRN